MTARDDVACIEAVERITDYLEGALGQDEARRLARHLETCPGCSEYLDQMRAVAGSLRGLRADPISAARRDQALAALRRRP